MFNGILNKGGVNMTDLRCMTNTCAHNEEDCCCRSNITVCGSQACCEEDTCCSSFTEQSDQTTNAIKVPKHSIKITCDARDCVHNVECNCKAPTIEVTGHGASSAKQTACASFAQR